MPPLIQIKNLTVDFPGSGSDIPALENFSMEIDRGEMLAVVGESGSGKSVMSLTLMNLLSPAARIVQGSVIYSPDGKESIDLLTLPEKKFRTYRGNHLAMIFQEPMTSLNPVMTCGAQCSEPLMQHKKMNRKQARGAVIDLFGKVRLPDPFIVFDKYPHQLSGGQKQRVMIAMAMSCHPALLICDEPTTALDVRVQKTILDLLKELLRSENMSIIFITHDLGLVADMADRALVMLRGRVVESGEVKNLFTNPLHPYTRGLLMCRPALHAKGERLPVVSDFLRPVNESSQLVEAWRGFNPDIGKETSDPGLNMILGKEKTVSQTGREVLVRVKGLTARYSSGKSWLGNDKPGVDAISDIHFEVYPGRNAWSRG